MNGNSRQDRAFVPDKDLETAFMHKLHPKTCTHALAYYCGRSEVYMRRTAKAPGPARAPGREKAGAGGALY